MKVVTRHLKLRFGAAHGRKDIGRVLPYSQLPVPRVIIQLSEGEPIAILQTENQIIMNKLEIKGDWNITKGKLQQKWAKLTDDDLQYVEGKQEELLGRIQKRTGETREAVEKAIKESCSACGCK